MESFDGPQLKPVWTVEIANGYSGPTVAEGRVYVTDRVESPVELERVLCFDAATGAAIWSVEYECSYGDVSYPDGPRASVAIADGRAYTVGTLGHVHCLDAATGKVLWRKEPDKDYDIELPIWGITASPVVEGDVIIAQLGARPDACIVAWDKKTGEERWRALEDETAYSAPIVIDQAGQRVLICWTADNVAGLDPSTGKVLWIEATPHNKMPINAPTPVVSGNQLFLTSFYDGSYMLRLHEDKPGVDLLWNRRGKNERRTDALHAMISTPFIEGNYVYGVDSHGELRCLDAKTGDRLWEDRTAVPEARWATIHMVRNRDKVWMFNERGEVIIAKLSPEGFNEISRTKLIEPTLGQLGDEKRGGVCWAHPAYANKHIFVRNDGSLVCASLAAE
jgi:outer membrane protein assembly factor BamB